MRTNANKRFLHAEMRLDALHVQDAVVCVIIIYLIPKKDRHVHLCDSPIQVFISHNDSYSSRATHVLYSSRMYYNCYSLNATIVSPAII
jgi:hypothetical protein